MRAYGVEPGDRAARFWGSGGSTRRRLRSRLADLAMNRVLISAFDFNEDSMLRAWQRLSDYRPVYLYGYASMLREFARCGLRHGLERSLPGLTAAISTSEPLYDEDRELMAGAFGAPVYNEYGCGEVGPIAYDCSFGRLHVAESNLWCEVARSDGSISDYGSGELLVTDLHNVRMPLIQIGRAHV